MGEKRLLQNIALDLTLHKCMSVLILGWVAGMTCLQDSWGFAGCADFFESFAFSELFNNYNLK